ncbi:MAG TPA: ribosomal-processing cysteine protease Prp [Candidatus Blautia excrementipullorum]|nr:ribosomal-processing cysteine protease Prp [Candidatus Blautia excrementipullorum]
MTKVLILQDGMDISIIGHAEKINEGKDNLLCCAVSVLGQTLAQIAMDIEAEGEAKASINIEKGFIRVKVSASKEGMRKFKERAKAIETGFELLKAEYPEQIFMAGEICF